MLPIGKRLKIASAILVFPRLFSRKKKGFTNQFLIKPFHVPLMSGFGAG